MREPMYPAEFAFTVSRRSIVQHPAVFSVGAPHPVSIWKLWRASNDEECAACSGPDLQGCRQESQPFPSACSIVVPVNISQGSFKKCRAYPVPEIQIITGAVSAMLRKRSSLSRIACSISLRP